MTTHTQTSETLTVEVSRDFIKAMSGCSCVPPTEACSECSDAKRRYNE